MELIFEGLVKFFKVFDFTHKLLVNLVEFLDFACFVDNIFAKGLPESL